MNRQQYADFHATFFSDARALMVRKNADYASDENPFHNFQLCEKVGLCPTADGVLVRMLDKIARLATYLKVGGYAVQGESFRDTALDLANYAAALAAIVTDKMAEGAAAVAGGPVVLTREEAGELHVVRGATWSNIIQLGMW